MTQISQMKRPMGRGERRRLQHMLRVNALSLMERGAGKRDWKIWLRALLDFALAE